MQKLTYMKVAEFLNNYFNLNRLGCLFYDIDYDTADQKERSNAGNKMRARLKNPTQKTVVKLNKVLSPFVHLKSDQEI